MNNYEPYSAGLAGTTGSIQACRHCGVKPANQHSLRESAACDWNKKSPAEKAKILAANAAKEQAA